MTASLFSSLFANVFPSWRFFDQEGETLRLQARFTVSNSPKPCPIESEKWQDILPPIERSLKNVFLNSRGNFLHASYNLVAKLTSEVTALDEGATSENIEASPNYEFLDHLVQYQIRALATDKKVLNYQFRIFHQRQNDDILLSPVYQIYP